MNSSGAPAHFHHSPSDRRPGRPEPPNARRLLAPALVGRQASSRGGGSPVSASAGAKSLLAACAGLAEIGPRVPVTPPQPLSLRLVVDNEANRRGLIPLGLAAPPEIASLSGRSSLCVNTVSSRSEDSSPGD